MLHAAALDPRIKKLALEETLESYQSVVDHRLHRGVLEHIVPGALRYYDLPALVQMMGSRPVVIVDAVDPMGLHAPADQVGKVYPSAKVLKRHVDSTAATLYGFGTR
jgi:hypothetical protein